MSSLLQRAGARETLGVKEKFRVVWLQAEALTVLVCEV